MYTKLFEYLNKDKVLVIVDVQKRFVNKRFVNKLFEYCKNFKEVYQLYYDDYYGIYGDDIRVDEPDYTFPNEKDTFVKGLNFYEYALDKIIWDEDTEEMLMKNEHGVGTILEIPKDNQFSGFKMVKIKDGQWFLIDEQISRLFKLLINKDTILVGGYKDECLLDIYVSMKSFGINVEINEKFVF
ncbi:MAG: hypothetical protein ACOC2W_03650 [bacterium]